MRIPLTIAIDYLPEWGVREGLRELTQNYLDAADKVAAMDPIDFERMANIAGDSGADPVRGEVSYSGDGTRILTFENPGADINRDALLLGVTSKANDASQRGKFGEGLKLGTLALLRAGKGVQVTTPSEVWTAKIESHDQFPGREVLVFNTRARRSPETSGVTVSVSGVTREEYEEMRSTFLCFQDPKLKTTVPYFGSVLLDPGMKGRVYVKGILVEVNPKLSYGFDLSDVEVDRDRKMVSQWSAKYAMSRILYEARKQSPTIDILELLEGGAPELEDASYSTDLSKGIAVEFQKKYGEDAYPCASMAEAQELEHSGVKGIPVPKALLDTLRAAGLDADAARRQNLASPARTWTYADLTMVERSNFQWAALATADAVGLTEEEVLGFVQVVDFKGDLQGLYKERRIYIARKMLMDRFETLATMLHEFAHFAGGDGEKGHVATLETLWTKVVRKLGNK